MQEDNPSTVPPTAADRGSPGGPSRLSVLLDRIPRPGVVAMVLAALLFSANTALAKVLSSNRSYSAFQNLYVRGVVTSIGSSIALLVAKRLPMPAIPDRADLTLWALGRGILGTCAIGALYFGVASLPLTESVVLFGLNPVFAMFFSKVFLDEPLSWLRVGALPLFLAGIVVSANPVQYASGSTDVNDYAIWIRRVVLILGAACSGAAIVFARKMNSVEPLHWAAQGWWQGTVAALSAPIMSFLFSFRIMDAPIDVLLMLGMGLCALGGQMCVGLAIQHEHAAIIGVLWNFDMVFALMWQAAIFANNPRWYDLAGVGCVFAASVVCVVEKTVLEWWQQRQQEDSADGDRQVHNAIGGDRRPLAPSQAPDVVDMQTNSCSQVIVDGCYDGGPFSESAAEAVLDERVPFLSPFAAPSTTAARLGGNEAETTAVAPTETATFVVDAGVVGASGVSLLTRTFDTTVDGDRMTSPQAHGTHPQLVEDAAWCESLQLSSKSTSLRCTPSSPMHPPIFVSSTGMPVAQRRREGGLLSRATAGSNVSRLSSSTGSADGVERTEDTPPPRLDEASCHSVVACGNPLSPLSTPYPQQRQKPRHLQQGALTSRSTKEVTVQPHHTAPDRPQIVATLPLAAG